MDTTVILAQPRVSRLRADVVYVDRLGMLGHPRANGRSIVLYRGKIGGDPPFELLHRRCKPQKKKSPLYSAEIRTPRVWCIDTRIYSPIGKWHPCAFDYWAQNLTYGYSNFELFVEF